MKHPLRSTIRIFGKSVLLLVCWPALSFAADQPQKVFPGADESSPSRSQYFSWINNTNEGATESQSLTNLAFFGWLKREYGLQLDIYAFDAGAIDGKRWYGSMESDKFKRQFPNGFGPVYESAKALGTRLGIWGGPDGFGATEQEAAQRAEMMVSLCRDYQFALFKFDTVAGDLRDTKQAEFADMMARCREYAPDLILLNHRINLGDTALPHATTFLWEGKETYTDVHMVNSQPAPHHRAGALERGLPPKLSRLTEDHGVCLSSALDHWDDELVLQAFNRALILSPQIYCNPWLLRDNEYPKLARIFNLAREHKALLVNATRLPKKQYGPYAVARGDEKTRLLTLRNLNWEPKNYTLRITKEMGLQRGLSYRIRQYHPVERVLGDREYGDTITVTVEPFRSALFKVSAVESDTEFGLKGVDYQIVKGHVDEKREIQLEGQPGQRVDAELVGGRAISQLWLDGAKLDAPNNKISVVFDGEKNDEDSQRALGKMRAVKMPDDAKSLYEATAFSADNNALELRSLERSGPSNVSEVIEARRAFFQQPQFTELGLSDKNLFDGDPNTRFSVMRRWSYWWNDDKDATVNDGGFRLDLGAVHAVDSVVLETRDLQSLQPAKFGEGVIAHVSQDLKSWTEVRFIADRRMVIEMPKPGFKLRYLRIESDSPHSLFEVNAYRNDVALNRSEWRASNLFGDFDRMEFKHAWQLDVTLKSITQGSFLAVAIPGEIGNEGAYAAMRVGDEWVGAPDRAPSYPANTFELQVKPVNGNYTYYFPLKPEWTGQPLEVVVLGTDTAKKAKPYVMLAHKPVPLAHKRLVVEFE